MDYLNQEPESAVLSIIFRNPDKLFDLPEIHNEYFSSTPNQILFTTIFGLLQEKKQISSDSILTDLKVNGKLDDVGGQEYIESFLQSSYSENSLNHYYDLLKQSYQAREVIRLTAFSSIDVLNQQDNLPRLIKDIINKLESLIGVSFKRKDINKIHKEFIEKTKEKFKKPSLDDIIKTGYRFLDLALHPQEGNIIVIGARPSVGKSTMLINLAYRSDERAKLYSLEMSEDEILTKIYAYEAKINSKKFIFGGAKEEEEKRWIEKAIPRVTERLKNLDILEYYGSIEGLYNDIRKSALLDNVKVFYIDYLQLLAQRDPDNKGNMNNAVGHITATLKQIASELGIVIYMGAQLNRGQKDRKDPEPTLYDLRDSGNIEQDAHIVAFLHPKNQSIEEVTNVIVLDELDFIVAKHRTGSVGKYPMLYNKPYSDIYLGKKDKYD